MKRDKRENQITKRVAANLQFARREKRWTQQDLAERLKCSKHAIMMWETCRNEISNETLLKIATALDKNWLWFYQIPEQYFAVANYPKGVLLVFYYGI